MPALDPIDLGLLDFLCAAHQNPQCRVVAVKASRRAALRRLRYAGLVGFDNFIPSPWALHDWLERKGRETPAAAEAAPAEPAVPEPVADGGGENARYADAPPPEHIPSGAELAEELTQWAKDNGASVVRVALSIFNSLGGIRHLKETKRPKDSTLAKVRAFLANPPRPEELPERAPQTRYYTPRKRERSADDARAAATARQATTTKARNWLNAGKNPASAPSAFRAEVYQEIHRREEATRLANPVEQAKRILQRRYTPVCSTETIKGPKGKFLVGRKVVDKAELLKMAGIAA